MVAQNKSVSVASDKPEVAKLRSRRKTGNAFGDTDVTHQNWSRRANIRPHNSSPNSTDNRFIAEKFILLLSVAWSLLGYEKVRGTDYGSAIDYEGTAMAILFAAGIVCQLYVPNPVAWEPVLRSSNDSGILYGIICFPLAFASWQLSMTSLLKNDMYYSGRVYVNFNFWAAIGCSCITLLRVVVNLETTGGWLFQVLASVFRVLLCTLFVETSWGLCSMSMASEHVSITPSIYPHGIHMASMLFMYEFLFLIWQRAFKNSFTLGEAMIVLQGVTLSTVDFIVYFISSKFPQIKANYYSFPVKERSDVYVALQGGLLGVLWNALVLYPIFKKHAILENETVNVNPRQGLLPRERSDSVPLLNWVTLPMKETFLFYCSIMFWLGAVVSPLVSSLLGEHPVLWVFNFTIGSIDHIKVAVYWLVLLVLVLPSIHVCTQKEFPLIIIRKLYHILALLLFVPAQLVAPEFLLLASGIATGLMLLVEYVRICRVPPFGLWLHKYLRTYTDSRDEGVVILTHLYLLIGCMAPLWLYHDAPFDPTIATLASFSGLIVLGAADAAGAIVGSTRGKWFWPGGRKTFEGTFAAFSAALLSFVTVYMFLDKSNNPYADETGSNDFRTVVVNISQATLIISLIEAFTKQIDNVTLPLMYPSLILCAFTQTRLAAILPK